MRLQASTAAAVERLAADCERRAAECLDGLDERLEAIGTPTEPGRSQRDAAQDACSCATRWPTTAETPSCRIETPYSASAISIVRFWCVMTIS